MKIIKAAAVQFNHKAGDIPYNLSIVEHFCQMAAAENVQLISFPEMCLTGYWHVRHLSRKGVEALAEPVPDGPSTQHLCQLSRQHNLLIGEQTP